MELNSPIGIVVLGSSAYVTGTVVWTPTSPTTIAEVVPLTVIQAVQDVVTSPSSDLGEGVRVSLSGAGEIVGSGVGVMSSGVPAMLARV